MRLSPILTIFFTTVLFVQAAPGRKNCKTKGTNHVKGREELNPTPVDLKEHQRCPVHDYGLIDFQELAGVPGMMTDYNPKQVTVLNNTSFTISLTPYKKGQETVDPIGSRVRSSKAYSEGEASATISSGASAPGVIGAFYLSNFEPLPGQDRTQDAINFEFIGNTGHISTNLYIHGNNTNNGREIKIKHLDEQKYSIKWNATHAVLSVDGNKAVEVYEFPKGTQMRPMKVYFSLWGSKPCDGFIDWSGRIPDGRLSDTFQMTVKDFKITGKEAKPVGLD